MKRMGYVPIKADGRKTLRERAEDLGWTLILGPELVIDDGKKIHKFHYLKEVEKFIKEGETA